MGCSHTISQFQRGTCLRVPAAESGRGFGGSGLRNFQRIVDWLEVPADSFLVDEPDPAATPAVIARHLLSDRLLTPDAAAEIAGMVAERYRRFVEERRVLEVQLRAARTFTPEAGALLGEILSEMHAALEESEGD